MKSNIRKLRNEKNISQTKLADVIGKTQQTVSHMERDRDRIPIESLITMSEYFGVSTDYILGIEDEEKQDAPVKNETAKNKDTSYDFNEPGREIEALKNIANGGNAKPLYELVLSMLLCSLQNSLQQASASRE